MQELHLRTLSQVVTEIRVRGDWPERVQLRRGWSLAWARPWNELSLDVATLRVERGGDRFLEACLRWLAAMGALRTLSPALAETQTGMWKRVGFSDHLELVVLERDLSRPPAEPRLTVVGIDSPDIEELAAIDTRAFDPVWQVGRGGLEDALAATPVTRVMGVVRGERTVGFAIIGVMGGTAYLQRLAVDPDLTGQGVGRSLVRAAMGWGARKGARAMLLNTQPGNDRAMRLYGDEGFVALGSRLRVLIHSLEGDD